MPRSTCPGSVSKTACVRLSLAVPTLAAAASAQVVTATLPRTFKPGKETYGFWATGSGGGLTINFANITGNSPTYIATIAFTNNTASSVTGANQLIYLAQE